MGFLYRLKCLFFGHKLSGRLTVSEKIDEDTSCISEHPWRVCLHCMVLTIEGRDFKIE